MVPFAFKEYHYHLLHYGHLHYFFWLLTVLSVVNLVVYVLIAKWYTYKTLVGGVSL
ncbi:hypothetical protein SLEP1_g41594 [Rubroshorea leprosula]|uniref:Uncharacterized protein n=1 Tax=Rubroshorea leprosula TaxID=152421 RepID=A0AAV5L712_9ROSI|nr:hypothetical protein SLEP1_g41594 [Rubroshorea leprosula]